jgi:hypothetical protein
MALTRTHFSTHKENGPRRLVLRPLFSCLFAQIELLSKPISDFREFRLAGVIELSRLANQNGLPGNPLRRNYYPGALALWMLA